MDTYSALIPATSNAKRETIAKTLALFGTDVLAFAAGRGIKVHALNEGQAYRDASPALRRLAIDVDAWPCPPAGLFVVEERSVYLRSMSPMTTSHEFGHALDCALGGGVYRSGIDPAIRRAFAQAKSFVTPYAATGLDEYFAECVRAYVEANDASSSWPRATRERLQRVDPDMSAIVAAIFDDLAQKTERLA